MGFCFPGPDRMLGTKHDTMCGEAVTGFYYLKSQIKLHTLWGEQPSWASGTKGFLTTQRESMKTGRNWLPYALSWQSGPKKLFQLNLHHFHTDILRLTQHVLEVP